MSDLEVKVRLSKKTFVDILGLKILEAKGNSGELCCPVMALIEPLIVGK